MDEPPSTKKQKPGLIIEELTKIELSKKASNRPALSEAL